MVDRYEQLSQERKEQQAKGLLPDWFNTSGYSIFKDKYLFEAESYLEQIHRIARCAASYLPLYLRGTYEKKFFNMLWEGWLSPSTPVLSNMGTNRGHSVSCSGGYIGDNLPAFYENLTETTLLTKLAYGTSSDLGDIRPRGSQVSGGFTASGVLPVFEMHRQAMFDVAQGASRRGSWAGYLPIDHGDFDELADFANVHVDGTNIGWKISDSFIDKLDDKDPEALRRYQKAMKLKLSLGLGYFIFKDKINLRRPEMYMDLGLEVNASNLCTEILLHSSPDYTFSCVLSSLNLAKFDEWKDTSTVFDATVFLDCVCQDMIEKSKGVRHLEKIRAFTEKGRALGLGVMGFHTLLQINNLPFDSFDAHLLNGRVFKHMHDESLKASRWMATELGEPEWCKGYGVRNTHRTAIAPTMSTSIILGGVSEGINPMVANAYIQSSAGAEMPRINPVFLSLLKAKGKYTSEIVGDIVDHEGSVQHIEWLTVHEKEVFKTAFEINQYAHLRLVSARQKYICQGQSTNLFFSARESEEYISEVHKYAFKDPNILTLYYVRTSDKAAPANQKEECSVCQ